MTRRLSRRQMLVVSGAGAAGLAAAGVAGAMVRGDASDATQPLAGAGDAAEFYGEQQAGIITPMQDHLHFVAFDVLTDKREELVDMLREWTAAAARMTAGRDAGVIGAVGGIPEAPPDDTGEALDLPASALTLTVGFGRTLFRDAAGRDRFGLADRLPPALADLPHLPNDAIRPPSSDASLNRVDW